MKVWFASSILVIVLASAAIGCTGSPATPTAAVAQPTAVPAATAKLPDVPTAAVAKATAAPAVPTQTAQPAVKVVYPEKGRPITFIVPYAAGGASDISVRQLSPLLEQALGVPMPIVNKGGASTQVALTELATSTKSDGYTIAHSTLPVNIGIYLDPERKAVFGRDSFELIANYCATPQMIAVKTDSPFKSIKDLLDAAKAKPGQIKVSDAGLLAGPHLGTLVLGKVANVELTPIHFDSGPQAQLAMLSGDVDAQNVTPAGVLPQVKNGLVRILGVMDKKRSHLHPDIPTMEEQGYKAYMATYYGVIAPKGVPKVAVDSLGSAVKKACESEELKRKYADVYLEPLFMDAAQFSAFWGEQDDMIRSLMGLAR